MAQHTYFMHPRVVKNSYLKGWKDHRTMVLGASLPCSLQDCPMKEACMRNSRDFDKACFWYRQFSERDDLRLSNSNFIEVDNFIEGNPAHHFTDFTKFMIGKMDEIPLELRGGFWDSVAFYNYDQNIHFTLNDNDSADHAHDTEENFAAFMEALEELNPEVIYVWFTQVRDILVKHHIKGLQEVDQLNVNGITVHRFIYNIQPTPHPEEVLQNFEKAFGFDTSARIATGNSIGNTIGITTGNKEYAEGYLLHALYRAQGYHQTLPYTPLKITEKMIGFAQPYAWDESLYIYLINTLQEHLGLDVAYEFIHQNWKACNDLYVASNFYCGIKKSITLHDFSPTELSFFSLINSDILKAQYSSEKLDYQFVYLNEDTEKRVLTSLFNGNIYNMSTGTSTYKIGLFLSMKDCYTYEHTIIETQRVKSIHLLSNKIDDGKQLVYIEMGEHAPIETIELYRNGEKVADSYYSVLCKRGRGECILPRELFKENNINLQHIETLDTLCQIGWIREIDKLNHYSVITDIPITITGQNVEIDTNMITKCTFGTEPQIRGIIYIYLIHKLSLQQKQIMNYFPEVSNVNHIKDEKRRATDLFKEHKMCKQEVVKEGATKFCGNLIEEHIAVLLKEKNEKRS